MWSQRELYICQQDQVLNRPRKPLNPPRPPSLASTKPQNSSTWAIAAQFIQDILPVFLQVGCFLHLSKLRKLPGKQRVTDAEANAAFFPPKNFFKSLILNPTVREMCSLMRYPLIRPVCSQLLKRKCQTQHRLSWQQYLHVWFHRTGDGKVIKNSLPLVETRNLPSWLSSEI